MESGRVSQSVQLRRVVELLVMIAVTLLLSAPLLAAEGIRLSPDGDGWVRIEKPHRYADVLLDSDDFTGAWSLRPLPDDVGKAARLLLVARVNNRWYSHDGADWQPWNSSRPAELRTHATRTLQSVETLDFLDNDSLAAGDYAIFAGYQVGNGPLVYNERPLQFSVQSSQADVLVPFASDAGMEAYLKQALLNGTSSNENVPFDVVAAAAPTAGATTTGSADKSAASRTSATNLQETGVDEADSIKVDGNHLYMLANCDNQACLQVHTLDSANAKAALVSSFTLSNTVTPDGMFFVERGILGQKMMVTVAGQNSWGGWFRIWGWREGKTELEFINLTVPQSLSSIEKLTLDGSLVASRRVGNVLYVVTRYTPAIPGFLPYAVDKAAVAHNTEVLENTSLPAIVPTIEDSRKLVEDLIRSKDCYLPASAVDGSANPSIITVTSVPLDSPTSYRSTCFLGASETLYMTPESLYLATTSWNYNDAATDRSGILYSPNHTTAIHKFGLKAGTIEYRGSGEVKGHLGWDQDKKSFRMGEHDGYLNIATSIGDSWNGTSSTRLTVLKEIAGSKSLQTVKTIDGIGLKGEQLYAARFLGDRGYLVTFRVTDPLYVLDLSNQEQPRVAGELKIDGYSDYLHPVSDTLLLGIGKDAVPDTRSSDENGRGAWYQGVKLSLFDVSNMASPREINSIVIGKRGTQSDVLWDHHALSFLPAVGSEPARLSIPVQLHDTIPTGDWFKAGDPSAWYDYTHTALYSLEISQLGVTRVGRLISEVRQASSGLMPEPRPMPAVTGIVATPAAGVSILPIAPLIAPVYVNYGGRSVLKDDAVFYIHDGKVLSSKWGESK